MWSLIIQKADCASHQHWILTTQEALYRVLQISLYSGYSSKAAHSYSFLINRWENWVSENKWQSEMLCSWAVKRVGTHHLIPQLFVKHPKWHHCGVKIAVLSDLESPAPVMSHGLTRHVSDDCVYYSWEWFLEMVFPSLWGLLPMDNHLKTSLLKPPVLVNCLLQVLLTCL